MEIQDDLVVIEWDGKKGGIPADKQMPVILQVENILGGNAVSKVMDLEAGTVSDAQLAQAYATVLRAAGFDVSDIGVLRYMQAELVKGKAESLQMSQRVVFQMLALLSPPLHSELMQSLEGQESSEKKTEGAA